MHTTTKIRIIRQCSIIDIWVHDEKWMSQSVENVHVIKGHAHIQCVLCTGIDKHDEIIEKGKNKTDTPRTTWSVAQIILNDCPIMNYYILFAYTEKAAPHKMNDSSSAVCLWGYSIWSVIILHFTNCDKLIRSAIVTSRTMCVSRMGECDVCVEWRRWITNIRVG